MQNLKIIIKNENNNANNKLTKNANIYKYKYKKLKKRRKKMKKVHHNIIKKYLILIIEIIKLLIFKK